jgi:SAM-dependent methyltransferase
VTSPDVREGALSLLATVSPRWREFTEYPDYFELRTTEFLMALRGLERSGASGPRRVLEVGCGGGYGLMLWSLVAEEVVGSDIPHAVAGARKLLEAFPDRAARIRIVESAGEDLTNVGDGFDLVVTQYVLEHVRDIRATLRRTAALLAAGGAAVHIVPSLIDRHEWYLSYRMGTGRLRRLARSLRGAGPFSLLRDPFGYTPPHSPAFGSFAEEHEGYRLERWAAHMLRAGLEVVDHFQTRDVNWVIVTRPVAAVRSSSLAER